MDRRTLLAVFLCVMVYYVWLNTMESKVEAPQVDSSTAEDQVAGELSPDTTTTLAPAANPAPVAAVVNSDLPVRDVVLEGCGARGKISTDGGVLHDLILVDRQAAFQVTPFYRWALSGFKGPWLPYGEDPGPETLLGSSSQALGAGVGSIESPPVRYEVISEDPSEVMFSGVSAQGVRIDRRYSVTQTTPCEFAIEVTYTNTSDQTVAGGTWVGVHEALPDGGGGGMFAAYQNQKIPYAYVNDDLESSTKYHKLEAPEPHEGPVGWFGLADRYFGFVLLPDDPDASSLAFSALGPEGSRVYGATLTDQRPLEAGERRALSFRVYMGDLKLEQLNQIHPNLSELVQLGWFAFFAKILLWLLHLFHAGLGNWGMSIIMLTLLVKMVFFPLTQASFKSSQAMSALQPRMKSLREEFKDNPEELNRRTMALFKDNGVNPLGGCLPMLVQFPVWISLYRTLLSSVDLYHTEFLYLKDLSSVDPYMILPAVVVVLMLVQQQFMPTGNMDPNQARMMKLMPLFFGIFFFTFPSGLVIYIFVNMTLSIAQQWFIKRTFKVAEPASAT